jgi:hypothetical protein
MRCVDLEQGIIRLGRKIDIDERHDGLKPLRVVDGPWLQRVLELEAARPSPRWMRNPKHSRRTAGRFCALIWRAKSC